LNKEKLATQQLRSLQDKSTKHELEIQEEANLVKKKVQEIGKIPK